MLAPSCVSLKSGKEKATVPSAQGQNQLRGWALMYPELANSNNGGAGEDPSAGLANAQGGMPSSTAPGMFDFSNMFAEGSAATGGLNWKKSASEAIQESRRTGKPLLTLITHYNSKPAQDMETTLLHSNPFRELSEGKMVLLRVDFFQEEVRRSDYYLALKERLRSKGYPTLVLTLPDGTEVLKLSGYKKEYQESYMRQLKSAMETMEAKIQERRSKMASQGYRTWKGKVGREVFARLISLDANKATFLNEWGDEFESFTNRLSAEDQEWIEQRRQQAEAARKPAP